MISLNLDEKIAMLQCIYQIVNYKGSVLDSEDDAIEQIIEILETNNSVWNIAVEFDPYKSFKIVSQLNNEGIVLFKAIVEKIVNSGGDSDLNLSLAHTVFCETKIEYKVSRRGPIDDNGKIDDVFFDSLGSILYKIF